jgi:O-antigen/teichoic acid export membrane protein
MQAAHRVAKNTGILYARMAITMFISLYATRLVLAALGVADFGLFNVVGGVIAMLGFLNSSMAAATQRFMSFAQGAGDLEKVKRIFNMSTLLHWGISVVILLVLEIASYFFFNGVLNIAPERLYVAKIIYQFMVLSTLFTVISVPYEAVITSHENMMVYAILGIIEAILKLGIALYITYSSQDHLVAYGFLMAALSIFLLILRRIYCHRYYAECVLQLRHYYDKPLLKEVSGFAGWSLLGSSSSMVMGYGQNIIINIFFGTTVNAAQSVARQISGQLSVLSLTLVKALNPIIDKSEGAGNRELMMKATIMGTKISFFLLSFLFVPFFLEMPFLLHLWLKVVPDYTIIFCYLMLIGSLLEQFYIPLNNAIAAVGNIKTFQKIDSLLNILPLLVVWVFYLLGYPPQTFYLVSIIFILVKLLNTLYAAKINCGLIIPVFMKNIVVKCFLSFLLSIVISFLPILFLSQGFFRLIVVLALGFICYPILIWNIGINQNEKFELKKIFKVIYGKIKFKSKKQIFN